MRESLNDIVTKYNEKRGSIASVFPSRPTKRHEYKSVSKLEEKETSTRYDGHRHDRRGMDRIPLLLDTLSSVAASGWMHARALLRWRAASKKNGEERIKQPFTETNVYRTRHTA